MHNHRLFPVLAVALLAILQFGCASRQYTPLHNGYGYSVSLDEVQDTYGRLVYTDQKGGKAQVVWPSLAMGYYGGEVIQDDLVVFKFDWPGVPGNTAVFAGG